jgi:hypothetical protein
MMNGRVPILGQQPQPQQQQIMAIGQVVACYMSLLPVVTAAALADKDGPEDVPAWVVQKAWQITVAAMKKIGICVPEVPTEP